MGNILRECLHLLPEAEEHRGVVVIGERDFLFIRYLFRKGGCHFIVDRSIDNNHFIPFQSIQRGFIHHCIFKVQSIQGGVLIHIDYKV